MRIFGRIKVEWSDVRSAPKTVENIFRFVGMTSNYRLAHRVRLNGTSTFCLVISISFLIRLSVYYDIIRYSVY